MAYAPARRPPRYARPWLYLAVVLAAALLMAAIAWRLVGRPDEAAGRFDPAGTTSHVHYQGTRYLADTEVLRLPETGLLAIGRTAEGHTVYASRGEAGGGGGALIPPPGSWSAGPVFLKTRDGRFVPLVPDHGPGR